jgi:hypothetical protein
MKSKKDIWQDEILQSIEGLQQAEPNAVLWTRLENQLKHEPTRIKVISIPKVWAAAASIFFLLVINIFVLAQSDSNKRNKSEILVDAYQLNTNTEIQLP